MRRWKVDKKYIVIAGLALAIILVSLVFNNLLEQGSKYDDIRATIKSTMLPIAAGFILAYLLNPVMTCAEKYLFMPLAKLIFKKEGKERRQKKFSRSLGVITTISLFMLLLVGGCCLVIPQIYVSVAKIVGDVPTYYTELDKAASTFLENDNEISKYILEVLDTAYVQMMEYVNTVVLPNMDKILKGITTGIIGGIKTTFNGILAVIISIYVLCEKENLISYGKKLAYSYLKRKHANMLIAGVRYVNTVFGGFINGKIIDSFIIGILCYLFMLIAGLEYAVLISIIVGVTNIIPYFGPFIGAIPSILILFMTEPKQGLIFAIFVLVLQQLDGNVIGPLILGDRLKISSMWILIAILIGGGLFGVPGMILGAPTLACIYALLRKDTSERLKKKEMPVESKAYLLLDTVNENMEVKYFDNGSEEQKSEKTDDV